MKKSRFSSKVAVFSYIGHFSGVSEHMREVGLKMNAAPLRGSPDILEAFKDVNELSIPRKTLQLSSRDDAVVEHKF